MPDRPHAGLGLHQEQRSQRHSAALRQLDLLAQHGIDVGGFIGGGAYPYPHFLALRVA